MYPAMLRLQEKKVVIIGGGKVALRKAKAFLQFGAKVSVVANVLEPEFSTLPQFKYYKETVDDVNFRAWLEDAFIVVAATNNRQLNQRIGAFCELNNRLCNVIDAPELSSFIVPAYVKRGDLILSISTGGNSPALAKKIKNELEEAYPESYAAYVARLGKLRAKVLEEITDEALKRQMLHEMILLNDEELANYEKSHFTH